MKRTGNHTGGWVLLWVLALALAGPGCAHLRKKPLPAPPMPPSAEGPGAEVQAEEGPAEEAAERRIQLKLDPTEILALKTGTDRGESETADEPPIEP